MCPAAAPPPLLLSDAIRQFDRFLEVERGLAAGTRKAYAYDLQKFKEWLIRTLKTEPAVSRITTATVRSYLAHLQGDKGYKSSTLSRAISSIKVLFEFCVQEEYLAQSPAAYIHSPKLPKKLPVYLIESELRKLLAAPDPANRAGSRDFAILVTLGFTGMRRSELTGLNFDAIDFERRTIRVLGKGNKERLIPMNPFVLNALNQWLEVRPVTGDPVAIFLNREGGRLTGRSVLTIVKKYVLQSGIMKTKISPHKLRHTFATLLHLNDVDILEIKNLLGHANISSTQIYTHTNTGKLRSAVDKLNNVFDGASPGGEHTTPLPPGTL